MKKNGFQKDHWWSVLIKTLMIMKLSIFILCLTAFSVAASETYSQNAKLSLSMHNVSIKDVLSNIEDKSEFRFFYTEKLSVENKVSIDCEKKAIGEVLDGIFEGTDIAYRMVGRQIALFKNTSELSEFQAKQQKSVSGKVTDITGAGLPGVSVVVKGTTSGVITDANGNYSLTIPSNAILSFSFVGMKSQEITIGNKTIINVVLEEESIGIEEVVAIGYGTTTKKDLTGSVSTISTEGLDKVPATTPLQALQGRAPGVQITTSSGLPGASASVLIRGVQSINGSNTPIYVVDGVITSGIDNINPIDIESVSILKDASASAIYGARAANGVILVTTKRGMNQGAPRISLNAYYGVQSESNLKINLLNANQWLELWTEAYRNAGMDIPWNDQILAHYPGVDTNWKDLMMQTGIIQNYDLSVEGGSEKSNYYVSAGYLDQKGMVIETGFKKYTLSFNSDHKIQNWIKFGNSLNIFATTTEGNGNAYRLALRKSPLTKGYEDDGDYGIIYNTNLEHIHVNPIWMAKETVNNVNRKGLQGNLYLTITPMKGLELTARGSMDYANSYSTNFSPGVDPKYGWEGTNINTVSKGYAQTIHWISDFLANYHANIKNHDIKLLLGYSLEESKYENLSGQRTGTPNNFIQYLDAGDPASQLNGNGFTDWSFVSVFSRLNYAFKNKYLITTTIRRDGTSRLAKNQQYGTFPSVSAAWRLSEENFMKGLSFIDDLKLRASYGTLGNVLSLDEYATISALAQKKVVLDETGALGYTLTSAVNTDLTWESVLKKNIGLDVTMFKNRLYSNITYFNEDTKNLLFSQPIAPSNGLSESPRINAGLVQNTGYEVELGYRKSNNSGWSYDISANLTHINNKVIDLEGRDLRTSGLVEGYPVHSYFGYKDDGIIRDESQLAIYQAGSFKLKQVGDIHLLDIDGYDAEGNLTGKPDGKVDAADRTIIGDRYPNLIYGAFGTVSYKNWSLQLQLQGVQGIDLDYGPTSSTSPNQSIKLMTSWAQNEDARILNRYDANNNPTGIWPRLSKSGTGKNGELSEFWLADASYLRVKNVNLNYNLPKKYCNSIGMSTCGVYASIQNAYTFTKYDGPEVDTTSDALTGVPQPRTWTFGIKATF